MLRLSVISGTFLSYDILRTSYSDNLVEARVRQAIMNQSRSFWVHMRRLPLETGLPPRPPRPETWLYVSASLWPGYGSVRAPSSSSWAASSRIFVFLSLLISSSSSRSMRATSASYWAYSSASRANFSSSCYRVRSCLSMNCLWRWAAATSFYYWIMVFILWARCYSAFFCSSFIYLVAYFCILVSIAACYWRY